MTRQIACGESALNFSGQQAGPLPNAERVKAATPPLLLHNSTMDATSAIVRKLRNICEYVGMSKLRSHRPFRFLDFPVEIRLLIYQELFGGARAHMVSIWEQHVPTEDLSCETNDCRSKKQVHGHLFHLHHDNTSCRFQSAVLRSCKTVYDKALPVLYATPVLKISMYSGYGDYLRLRHASHIRRIMTDARGTTTMKEHGIVQGYRLSGIQWAIDVHGGLGSRITKILPDGLPGFGAPVTPIEYEASDVKWLFIANSTSELKHFGGCFRPFSQYWYIRKGSTALHDRSSKTSTNYLARGPRSYAINYRWASS